MYVLCRRNTVAQYIATWTILELCLLAERRMGEQMTMRWWEQSGINIGEGDTEMEEEGEME